jgi:hypothetical protein
VVYTVERSVGEPTDEFMRTLEALRNNIEICNNLIEHSSAETSYDTLNGFKLYRTSVVEKLVSGSRMCSRRSGTFPVDISESIQIRVMEQRLVL